MKEFEGGGGGHLRMLYYKIQTSYSISNILHLKSSLVSISKSSLAFHLFNGLIPKQGAVK